MDHKQVEPTQVFGNGPWNHFTGRKKYSIVCGACQHTWSDKVPFFASDTASSVCPACGAQNRWSHSDFERGYNKMRAATR